jgi:hypothetical protein
MRRRVLRGIEISVYENGNLVTRILTIGSSVVSRGRGHGHKSAVLEHSLNNQKTDLRAVAFKGSRA